MKKLHIRLLGSLSIADVNGQDLTPTGRKAQALLAMLATGRDGRRTRAWLQSRLWSDRGPDQAAGSLRSCLYEIRSALSDHKSVLQTDRVNVRLDLGQVTVDVLDMTSIEWLSMVSQGVEFLEGLDVADEEFNHWLVEQRQHWSQRSETPHQTAAQPTTPEDPRATKPEDRPDWALSVTVFPLENVTGEDKNTFMGIGLSEDLVTRMQRLRWLPVIRAPATLSGVGPQRYSGAAMADGLGAQFYVEGSISQERNARIGRFRLTEAETARVIWSQSYDLDPFLAEDALDTVFNDVVASIDRTVSRTVLRKVMAEDNRSDHYQDQIWRGRWHLAQLTRADSQIALRHLENALKINPNVTEGLIQMAFWHLWRNWVGRDDGDGLGAAEHFARKAMTLDPDDGRIYAVLGIAEAWRRNHASAIMFLNEALDLNPNLAIAHHQLGSALIHDDRPDEAIAPIAEAMRYSPRDQLDFAFQTEMAVALTRTGAYEEAYVRATRALMMKPRYWYGHLVRILVAEQLGDAAKLDEARRAFDHAGIRLDPHQIEALPFRSADFPRQLREIVG